MKIDTLLLDLDGTLVDSNELILETFRQTFLTHFPLRRLQRADLLQMMGPPLYETFGNYTTDPALVQQMIKTYLGIYVALEFHYIRIYPGVIETLQYFHENHFHLAIVTTKFQKSAAPCLERFHLRDVVDLVVALDDVKNPKPDPEAVEFALKRLGSRHAVMIGDNTSDLQAGSNAGILTCGVGWSYKKEMIRALKPDFWIESFPELISIIKKYNEEE